MTGRDISLLVSIAFIVVLGFMVYWTNPRRTVNQHFVSATAIMTAWLLCMAIGFRAHTGEEAVLWIRLSCATGAFVPFGFNLLRLSVIHPTDSWFGVLRRMRWWCALKVLVVAFCLSDFLLTGATIPNVPQAVAEPTFGKLYPLYGLYIFATVLSVGALFLRDLWNSEGMQRVELQYMLFACFGFMIFGAVMMVLMPFITGDSQAVKYGFLNAILFESSIAYGIVTQRILSMATLLRRITAYALLAAYLTLVWFIAWVLATVGLRLLGIDAELVASLLAAIVTALALAPANSLLQNFVKRLFISYQEADPQATMQFASRRLNAVMRVPELLDRFSEITRTAMGTERIVIFMREADSVVLGRVVSMDGVAADQSLEQSASYIDLDRMQADTTPFRAISGRFLESAGIELLQADDPLIAAVSTRDLLVRDQLVRGRETEISRRLLARMSEMKLEVLMPIRLRHNLVGVMGLGRRLSGRIYSRGEQDTLDLLCSQLNVSLANARLYTQAEDSRRYIETLLDSLLSCVIAVDRRQIVTVCNREAEHVLGLPSSALIGQSCRLLPAPLVQFIDEILATHEETRDREIELPMPEGEAPITIRLSCAVFSNHDGGDLGVLLVFHDLTAVKRLQHQVQHSDRLASIGRLSAGMAHEIKNPLVTIKTFAQLLPERYHDEEFRTTFSELVGDEVNRIDNIVRQLLQFSRPARTSLSDLHLHPVVERVISLVRFQAAKQQVQLQVDLAAIDDSMSADDGQIQQAIVNLTLNAIEAMPNGGQLTISTAHCDAAELPAVDIFVNSRRWLCLRVEDTGCGIKEGHVNHIFEPFFTTRSTGTGLGLSVVHGIITEHGGQISVASQPHRGTTFSIYLPLSSESSR